MNFNGDKCLIISKKKGQLITTITMALNKIYSLKMPTDKKYSLKCGEIDESTLWHLRYGHLNFYSLKILKHMVKGLPSIINENKI